jgi:5-methylcytosine-specific restriction endonuclease McrA
MKKRIRQPHKDRSKFRKNSFTNVDYDDRLVEYSPAGNPRRKYRMLCIQCGQDRGYQTQKDALRVCTTCQTKNQTCYTKEQKRVRCAMKANLSAKLKQRLINKCRKSTFDVLSYTVDDLIKHLESKFQPGMTWNNYGEWEIDHITPDSWFEYNSFEDEGFQDSWALENLQPLWAKPNRSKGNRYKG